MLTCADKTLDLSTPGVMGVLNITPDSFSDGGRYLDPAAALDHAHRMVEEGAIIIDIGGESTRPGAAPVPVEEELRRVIPLVERLAPALKAPVSVDTSKPEVMRAALAAGAGMINDVCALRLPGALEALAGSTAAICLMHMQGEPRSMQTQPHYDDVVAEVEEFLAGRVTACVEAGISRGRLVLDPGFGFGKTVEHNLTLLAGLKRLEGLGLPVLAGLSRKSMIGAITGRPVEQRLAGGLAAAVMAIQRGASIIRTHDVAETCDALRMVSALRHYS